MKEWREAEGEYLRLHGQERYWYYRTLQLDIQLWLAGLINQTAVPNSLFIPFLLAQQKIIRRLVPDFPHFHHFFSFPIFQNALYKVCKRDIWRHLQHTKFFGAAFDTYTSTNMRSLLGCTIRFYTKEWKEREIFLGFVEIDARGEGAPISVEHIRQMLANFDLTFAHMISATFDGASVNLGARHGIGALLAELCPWIHIGHCFAHAFVVPCVCVWVCVCVYSVELC
jgi:hypothetical protein